MAASRPLALRDDGGPLCGPFPTFSERPELGEFTLYDNQSINIFKNTIHTIKLQYCNIAMDYFLEYDKISIVVSVY